jgi:DNA modification methylase
MFSIEGDLVLDPFLGSGTSLKAAMNLNRRFVGYEKLEDFSRIIGERLGEESDRVLFQKQSIVEKISSALTA